MKKKLNNDDLDEKGVDTKYYLFYQIWSELTDEKTLDTYQFKIMNTISALEELEKVLNRRVAGYYSSNKNVEDCMKETCSLVRNDSVLKEYYPVIRTRLLSHLGMKCESDAAQKTLIHRLEYCLKIVREDYFEKLIVSLEKSINDNDVEKIIKKANQLVSCCISRGWSAKVLGKIISRLNESKNNLDKWESFKNRLLNKNLDEYRIFLPLRIRPRNAAGQRNTDALVDVKKKIQAMDISLVEGSRIAEEYPELENKVSQEQTYIDLNKKSYDIYTASHKAISEYAKVLNILSFYNLIEAWNIQDISWVVVNVSNRYNVLLKSKDLYSTYDYMEGANGIFKSSRELDKNEKGILKTKLLATYSYANIGKASYSQEDKFINLWVALESLCRTDMYENIISNVLETVPPALCSRYIYRCFRNFAEDCLRCNIAFDLTTESVNLRHPEKEKVVRDIIAVLKDEQLYQEVLEKCRVNNLLFERCKEMKELATNPEVMFAKIENHYENVKRQISRLYRIRNEIAHSALNDAVPLTHYIEHLEDYLATFVSEVVKCWEKHQGSNVEEIFEMIKDNYKEYSDIRSAKKQANPGELLEGLRASGIVALI